MLLYFIFLGLLAVIILPLPATAALRVFACEPEWAALVSELAGGKVKVDTFRLGPVLFQRSGVQICWCVREQIWKQGGCRCCLEKATTNVFSPDIRAIL